VVESNPVTSVTGFSFCDISSLTHPLGGTTVKKLSKTQQNELNAHVTDLATKKQEIDDTWEKFEQAWRELATAIGEYNTSLAAVTEWRDGIVQEMSDYLGERSEKWQEGDAGQAYQAWMDEWEGLDLEEVDTPDMPDAPDFDHIDAIEQMPTEAESA
jgi:uncharacterized protein YukE